MEAIHSAIGGFTDYEAGSYSFGRLIRNHVKKNEQPDLEVEDVEKLNEQIRENNDTSDKNLNKRNDEVNNEEKNEDIQNKKNIDEEEKIVVSFFKNYDDNKKMTVRNIYRKFKLGQYKYGGDAKSKDSIQHKVAGAIIDFFTNIRSYQISKDMDLKGFRSVNFPSQDGKIAFFVGSSKYVRIVVNMKNTSPNVFFRARQVKIEMEIIILDFGSMDTTCLTFYKFISGGAGGFSLLLKIQTYQNFARHLTTENKV